MRDLILHIGMHKTGTTSIQNSLYKLNKNGFRTIRFIEKNHSIPLFTIFSENRTNYHIWKKRGLTHSEILAKKTEYEEILENELTNDNVNVFLLSGEGIANLTENEKINLCRYFQEKKLRVRVVYVVRDPISWAISANQEIAKGGAKTLLKVIPDYKRRVLGFIKGCGYENILTYKYENLIQGGLIRSFSEIIGCELTEGMRENESLTSEALSLIYCLNNISVTTVGSQITNSARAETVKALRLFFSRSNGFHELTLENYNLLDSSVCMDLDWLSRVFKISYEIPDVKRKQVEVLDQYPDFNSLSEFFGNHCVQFHPSLPIGWNMENLFKKFFWYSEIDEKVNSLISEKNFSQVLKILKKAIELGDKRHLTYHRASKISQQFTEFGDAINFAKKAVTAKDNYEVSRNAHIAYLEELLRVAPKKNNKITSFDL